MSSTLQPSMAKRGCGGTQKILCFFTVLLLLINFLAHSFGWQPYKIKCCYCFHGFASIKPFQLTAETTTRYRRPQLLLHSLIPCAQDGSLCTASWTPHPREAAGQLLAGKHRCNYSAWTLGVKELTHIPQTAQPHVAELLCWHLPPSISASPSMQ